eukprot:452020_1
MQNMQNPNQMLPHNVNITQNQEQQQQQSMYQTQPQQQQMNAQNNNEQSMQQNNVQQFNQSMQQVMAQPMQQQYQPQQIQQAQIMVAQAQAQPQPQSMQIQHAKYAQLLQQYTMMMQKNPMLQHNQDFIRQYSNVRNALAQVQQQITSPTQVIVGGNGLSIQSINQPNTNTNAQMQQQHAAAALLQSQNNNSFDLNALGLQNMSRQEALQRLQNMQSAQNAQFGMENDNNTQQTISDNAQNATLNNNTVQTNTTPNNNSTPTYLQPNASPQSSNTANVQLSLPNLNQSTFKTAPNQPNINVTTPGGPSSDSNASGYMTPSNIQQQQQQGHKRSRGRPRGSRNKRQLDVNAIDKAIESKKQEIADAKAKYDKAKQTYVSIENWLSKSADSHRQQIVQQFYTTYAQTPQYANYRPEQIMQFAQSAASQRWQQDYNKLQTQYQTAHAQVNEIQNNKIKPLTQQLAQLQVKRDEAVKNAPGGPIAEFEAQYRNKQGGMGMDRYSNGVNNQMQRQQTYRQSTPQQPQYPNPWQSIIDAGVDVVPQWAQCANCRKWRVLQVSIHEITTWSEPQGWTCSMGDAPTNHCTAVQEKPDQSVYSAVQLQALTIQRTLKMQQSERRRGGQQDHSQSQTELTRRMYEFKQRQARDKQRQEFMNKNNDTFSKLMNLVDIKDRKDADERFEMLKQTKQAEKAAIRAKKAEREATRQAKKKKLRNKDSDDEYLPDSDDTTDDEEYGESDTDLDDDDMLLDRAQMRARHQAPSTFNFQQLLSDKWSHPEIMALVAFAAQTDNQFDAEKVAQHPVLAVRHNNPTDCKQKLEQIMAYIQQIQNPTQSSTVSSSFRTRNAGRNKSVDSEDESYDAGHTHSDEAWGGSRKSKRLASKKSKKPNYAEELAIDKYLAREEAEVRTSQKAHNDIYEEKIERILAQKTVFVAPKTDAVYDDMQHALDHGCKASELLEQTRFLIKLDGISYLHCEWETEVQMMHRFGKLRVTRKIQTWKRQMQDYVSKCELLWGGEPFDASFAQVDRIIDCIDVDGVKKYYVKWMGLSYSCCTYETAQDIDAEEKIKQFERWNKIPTDTKARHLDDAAFKKGMYGWYKITESKDQPAQNEADGQMKQELQNAGVEPDAARVYKGENTLRDYQVIGLNWLIQKFYEGSNSILADEMGLGKTVQSTTFIEHLYRVNNVHGPFLIVAPLSTLFHWKREIEDWTDLNCVVYHDSEKGQLSREIIRTHEFYYAKSKRKTPKFNILLTTYEILMMDLEWLANIKWFLCIVDEGHRLKSRSTQLAKSFEMLDAQRRVLLTGTPIQNSMDELFNLLHFLEPKEFKNLRDFNRIYGASSTGNTNNNNEGEIRNTSQLNALQSRIQQYILRRLKENVEKSIPKKEETIIDIELTTIQKTYYRALFDRNREFLEAGVDKGNLPNLINLEVQLRKCCNHPWLIDGTIDRECGMHLTHQEYMEKTIAASGKMVLLDKLLPKLKREGHRVLIFSQMRKVLNILEEYLEFKQYIYERFDGTTSSHDRQSAIDRFCAPGSDRLVFLLTTRAGGQGLNLVAADTVIIFDSDWNPQQDIQAQARCHRIGQHKTVGVYRLVTKNTYEAQMFERASRKLGLGQAILKSVEHGVKKKDVKDLKQLDNMLRHGAYAILNDDDETTKKWQECDIDELLQHASHRIEHKEDGVDTGGAGIGMHSFTRKTFESDKAKATAGLDVTGENFWNDLWKIKKRTSKGDDDLYLDNYLLDDRTRAERLLTSLTSMKDAANESAKLKRKETMSDCDEDSDIVDDLNEKMFANSAQRDKWFKRYKLHMTKMVQLKESPNQEVPSLELQIQLSELVFSLQTYFTRKQQKQIAHWNSKLTQRNRRKAKMSLNEDMLSQPHWNGKQKTLRSSKRKRKRSNYAEEDMSYDYNAQHNNKKRKENNREASPRDNLDKVWAFDYPSYAFNWADYCAVCEGGGTLILCDGPCVGSFHLKCLGLATAPEDDPWYCDECKELKAKREETYKLTGGKSSRFKPGTYKIRVWMDRDNEDANDVFEVKTESVFEAKCFYASKKKKKSSKKKKQKRSRAQMETEGEDADYTMSDDGKPVRKRSKKRKAKAKLVDSGDILNDFGPRMTRSRKKNLSKILNEGNPIATQNDDEINVVTAANTTQEQVMEEKEEEENEIQKQQYQQQLFNLGNQLKIDWDSLGSMMNVNNIMNQQPSNLNNMTINSMNNMILNTMNNMNSNSNMTTQQQQQQQSNMIEQPANNNTNSSTTIINNITNIHNINNAAAANMNHPYGGGGGGGGHAAGGNYSMQ